ncbi:MAG: TonB-dependent receptor [Flavobacteriales bacterium]|nr:TonB-dependent receptor [Flavobacteriales bacterium]
MLKFKVTILLLVLLNCTVFGSPQDANGIIKGVVQETQGGSSVPVPFANVFLLGTSTGGSTDFDGNFEFEAKPGEYKLVVSSLGYKPDTMTLVITPGAIIEKIIQVSSDAAMLEMVEIVAKVNRESESLLLMEQKNNSTITQSIGASELSNKGASDVAQGIAKMSGVSRSEASSDIFVRGLGDRYNTATLNGLPIPSSNPDKKVIDLSIFPSSVVKSIDVSKTFTPNQPSDFAGAAINISTKDYYEDPFVQVGFSTAVNSISTGKPFQQAQTEKAHMLSRKTNRDLPNELATEYENAYYSSPADASAPIFERDFNPIKTTAGPSLGYSLLGGTSYDVGSEGKIGFLFSGEQSSGYQYREGFARNTDSSGIDKNYFSTETFTKTDDATALGNLFYQMNDNHSVQFNVLYTQNISDEVSNFDSRILDRDRNTYTYSTRNTLKINSLRTAQVLGSHAFNNDQFQLKWGASHNQAQNSEPDRTQLLFEASDSNKDDYRLEALNASDNHRFYSTLEETEVNGNVDLSWRFNRDEYTGKAAGILSAGIQPRFKNRTFEWRQFNMSMRSYADSLQNNKIVTDLENPDAFLNDDAFSSGHFQYEEARDGSRVHQASQNILAGYLMLDYSITPRLLVVAGVRIEQTSQVLEYKQLRNLLSDPYQVKRYDTLNVLPSVSLKYQLTEKSNLRLAASQTVSRPNFRELAPFQYQDQSRRLYEGNTDLVNGYAYNLDVKYEVFPNYGELFAVSAYAKYIDNPIERYEVPSSTTLFTYFNLGRAIVAGLETEIKTSLGRFAGGVDSETLRVIDRVTIGLNLAYNYTQLYVGTDGPINTNKGTIIATNSRRQMQGASPYLISSDLSYEFDLKSMKSRWSLVYNVGGPSVFLAGTYGRGDVYERPVHSLDFIMKNKVSDRVDINVSLRNLLNPSIVQEQTNAGQTFVFNEYKLGRTAALSVNYRFFKSEG